MSSINDLTVLVLIGLLGLEVNSKVRDTRHTPLMSGTTPINGVVLFGGILTIHIITTGLAHGVLEDILRVIGITFGTINVIGALLVTKLMLGMFKRKPDLPESTGMSKKR